MGTHHGEFASGDLMVRWPRTRCASQSGYGTEGHARVLSFTGKAEGGKMSAPSRSAIWEARWTAERHQYGAGGRGRRG